MKEKTHHIIILLLVLFTVQPLSAQTEIGFYSGLKRGKFYGDAPPKGKYKPRLGYDFGAHLDIGVSKFVKISLQPGIGLSGSIIAFEDTVKSEYKDSVSVSSTNFLIPLYVKITSLNEKIYFLGGLKPTINLNSTGDDTLEQFDLNEEFKSYNVSAVFGLGILIPVERSSLYIELRYSQGLVNITNSKEEDQNLIPRVKTSAFNLVFGWKIPVFGNNKRL